MILVTKENGSITGTTIGSLEEGIRKLYECKEKGIEAYIEDEDKRLYAADVEEGKTLEVIWNEAKEITAEEIIADIDADIERSDGDYDSFELADTIGEIKNKDVRLEVFKHYAERLWGIPALTDRIAQEATFEQREELKKIYEENGIGLNSYIFKIDSIEMRTAEAAAQNWGMEAPQNLGDAKKITDGSEIAAVHGIVETLGIDPSEEEFIVEELYEKTELTSFGDEIKEKIDGKGKNAAILAILSTIHNNWIKKNPNNFLKEGRNREYQFVPLELLSWGEVKKDLLFLKPILEGAGVEIDEEELKKSFDLKQNEYMVEHSIYSHEDLVKHIRAGFYPLLKDLETVNKGNIERLLREPENAERLASQIETQIPIKSRGDVALDIIRSDVSDLDEVSWIYTSVNENPLKFGGLDSPRLDNPISKREILLSKAIGRPYPTYFLDGVSYFHDEYRNEIVTPVDMRSEAADRYKRTIDERKEKAKEASSTKGKVRFGFKRVFDPIGYYVPREMEDTIEISEQELLLAGLDPEKLNLIRTISSRNVAKLDREKGLTKTETERSGIISYFKDIISKIKAKFTKDEGDKDDRV